MILILTDTERGFQRMIGAYRVATALRSAGLEVEVIDYISRWPFDKLIEYIDSFKNLDWVGFSSKFGNAPTPDIGTITLLPADDENKLISYIKNKIKIPVVVGGATADYIRPRLVGKADYVLKGYADVAVIALHNHITQGHDLVFQNYKGIKFIDCDEHYKNIDLGNIETYYVENDFIDNNSYFPLEIGRGCIFKCSYCNFSHIGKKPGTYFRDKESIKRDIIDKYTKYNSTKFYFLDDTFNDSTDKMQMIAEIREETGIPFEFWAYCRVDVLAAQKAQQDLIDKIGWKSMTIGIESFNKETGKLVGKGADPTRLRAFILDLLDKHPDLEINVNIIIGLPKDTMENINFTVEWFEQHPALSRANFIPLQIYNSSDSEGRKITSTISKDPAKFGYTIKKMLSPTGVENIIVDWSTGDFTYKKATELAKELNERLRLRFAEHTLRQKDFLTRNFSWPLKSNVGTQYINKKLRSRNLGEI